MPNSIIKFCFRLTFGKFAGDFAEDCACAGMYYHHSSQSALDEGAKEYAILRIYYGMGSGGKISGLFFYRKRFAGKRGFPYMQVIFRKQTAVCRYQAAGVELDYIPRHQL
jgi:hypothetical protein